MTDQSISPLRRRMTEDMTVRGFTASTQRGYPLHTRKRKSADECPKLEQERT